MLIVFEEHVLGDESDVCYLLHVPNDIGNMETHSHR